MYGMHGMYGMYGMHDMDGMHGMYGMFGMYGMPACVYAIIKEGRESIQLSQYPVQMHCVKFML